MCFAWARVSKKRSRTRGFLSKGSSRALGGSSNFGGREFEDEARADGGVVFDAEETVVFGDDARGDGEAEAGAAILGREMREEKFVFVRGRNAVTGVFHGNFDRVGFGVEVRANANVANGGGFKGFGCVVN